MQTKEETVYTQSAVKYTQTKQTEKKISLSRFVKILGSNNR